MKLYEWILWNLIKTVAWQPDISAANCDVTGTLLFTLDIAYLDLVLDYTFFNCPSKMPLHCIVFGCRSFRKVKSPTRPLFKFPKKDTARLDKWINFVMHTNKWPLAIEKLKRQKICFEHFEDKYIINKMQLEMGHTTRLILSHDAVPTIYPLGTCPTVTTVVSEVS